MVQTTLTAMMARLDESRSTLLSYVQNLSQDTLDWKPSETKWSVGEVLHHIVLVDSVTCTFLERLIELERQKVGTQRDQGDVEKEIELPVDFEDHITEYPVFKGAVPEYGIEATRIVDMLSDARKSLLQVFSGIEHEDLSHISFPHPAFGRLDIYQWLLFVAVHERGHTKQIASILALQQEIVQ